MGCFVLMCLLHNGHFRSLLEQSVHTTKWLQGRKSIPTSFDKQTLHVTRCRNSSSLCWFKIGFKLAPSVGLSDSDTLSVFWEYIWFVSTSWLCIVGSTSLSSKVWYPSPEIGFRERVPRLSKISLIIVSLEHDTIIIYIYIGRQ